MRGLTTEDTKDKDKALLTCLNQTSKFIQSREHCHQGLARKVKSPLPLEIAGSMYDRRFDV
jgi:hypothetical protein